MAELKFPKASVIRTFTLQTELIDPPVVRLELTPASGKDKLRQTLGWVGNIKDGEEVKKLPPEALLKFIDTFDGLILIVSKHVIGWDLTVGGEPIPCTDEEKAKWLEPLLWETVEPESPAPGFDPGDDEEKKPDTWLWSTIFEVISDRGNFLKN
jgi:hypothetical protein